MLINKLKKKYNNIAQINLFNNEILCGNRLILCNNDINEKTNPNYFYEENSNKNINNKKIFNLNKNNKNNIYLVLGHYFTKWPHIHHIFYSFMKMN